MSNRILKDSICTSDTIAALQTPDAEVLFYRLLVVADDYGCYDGRIDIIRAQCYPLVLDRVSTTQIEAWLDDLTRVGLVQRYEVEGKPYIALRKWFNHQRLRQTRHKWPEPPGGNLPQPAASRGLNPNPNPNPNPNHSLSSAPFRSRKPVRGKKPRTAAKNVDNTAKVANTDRKRLMDYYAVLFKSVAGQDYVFQGAKDATNITRLMLKRGYKDSPETAVQSVLTALDFAFQIHQESRKMTCPDKYDLFPDTLALFVSRVNRYTKSQLETVKARVVGIQEAIKNKRDATGRCEPAKPAKKLTRLE